MGRLFGTDGVRGVANTELTGEMAFQLGRAGAYVLTKETKHAPRILVGMDTRISGDMLEAALVAGICSVGAHAVAGRHCAYTRSGLSGTEISSGCRRCDFCIP